MLVWFSTVPTLLPGFFQPLNFRPDFRDLFPWQHLVLDAADERLLNSDRGSYSMLATVAIQRELYGERSNIR